MHEEDRLRGSRRGADKKVEIVSIGESTLGAFAVARAALASIVLGGFLFRTSGSIETDEALVQLGFMLIALVGLVSASMTLSNRIRDLPLQNARPWYGVLLDSCLAIGVMASIDAETSPLAWLALIVPVVEAAVLFSMVPAAIVWIGLSIAFLALRLTADQGTDTGSETLALAVQQVLAVFLVSGPAALLSDGARQRINQLADARRNADLMADRLRRIAQSANDMSQESSVAEILSAVTRGAVTIGFDQADILTRSESGKWIAQSSQSLGPSKVPPMEMLVEAESSANALGVKAGDPRHAQALHSLGLVSGHGIRISQPGSTSPVILRAWSRHRAATDQEVKALELFAGHAREIHRTALVIAGAEAHAEQLLDEVRHDGLTGLANRNWVLSTLEERLAQRATMAIFFIDLDGFKQINDTIGHRAGDAALKVVAERLSRLVRPGALAGRMGGDEFIVLTPVTAFDSMRSLTRFGDDLVTAISKPMTVDGHAAQLGASIGLAISTTGIGADQLISSADNAMYEAKRNGGGVEIANELPPPIHFAQDAS